MKVKFNRNVKHDGRFYEAGKVYDFDGALSEDVSELLELVHEDVHTQKNTTEHEEREVVKIAEEAPASAEALPQPPVMPKSATPGVPAQKPSAAVAPSEQSAPETQG